MTAESPRPFRVTMEKPVGSGRRRPVLPVGLTEWDLRSSRFRRLFRGVYVASGATITPLLLGEAALLLVDAKSLVSHHSAARIWGGIVPDDGLTHITCSGRRPQVAGLLAHRLKPGQGVTTVRGVRVTPPAQTFLDLAAALDLVELVVLGDSLVRKNRVTPEQLVEAAASFRGGRRALARRAASYVRRDVDSAMETRLRMLIVLAGLPEPTINHKIYWADGRVRWRFDLSYPQFRLIIEYDGQQHRDSTDQWSIDIERREWMDQNDWRMVVVISRGIYRTPAATLQRIVTAMRDRGMVVPRLSDEWRRYFPSLPDDIAELA